MGGGHPCGLAGLSCAQEETDGTQETFRTRGGVICPTIHFTRA